MLIIYYLIIKKVIAIIPRPPPLQAYPPTEIRDSWIFAVAVQIAPA